MPARSARGSGCSIRSTPASASSAAPRSAVTASQAWFTSTRTDARSPSARLMAVTWAHVLGHVPLADLELEGIVPPRCDHRLGLGNVGCGAATGQGPEHGDPIAHPSAQQGGQRHAQLLALNVEQRRLHRVLREVVTHHGAADRHHQRGRFAQRLAQQQWRHVAVNRQLDRFRALVAIGKPADRGALTMSHQAIGGMDAHQCHALPADRRHRQDMRPDCRDIDNSRYRFWLWLKS